MKGFGGVGKSVDLDGGDLGAGTGGVLTSDISLVNGDYYCAEAEREPVNRQDLIDMSLKLQEALSLITQALGRMRQC